jgi:hypothetical protein
MTTRFMAQFVIIKNCFKVLSTIFTLIYVLHFFSTVWIYLGVAYPSGWYASENMFTTK